MANGQRQIEEVEDAPKMTVFDAKMIEKMGDMASLREYKLNGKFNPRVLATCPSLTRCHTSSGEPLVHEPPSATPEPPHQTLGHHPIKLINRIDFIELDE